MIGGGVRASEKREAELSGATLDDLRARYPAEWEKVSEAILGALATGRAEKVAALARSARAEADLWRARLRKSGGNPAVAATAWPPLVRERMGRLALEKTALALAAREAGGTVRLGLWSGLVTQRLLFLGRGLERKPVSLAAFRLLWPLVPDRRLVLPLVQSRGIYCFYSRELVRRLAALCQGPTLEIAAGDGTLSRFLSAEGAPVTATDDGSWSHVVEPPAAVERLEARAALSRHRPRTVLCSWPPPGNPFERAVFETPSVERYLLVTSRHRFAAGDWQAYQRQRTFTWAEDPALSALVLPPELDPAVLVFQRRG